jgi:amidohydrolase
MRGLILGALAVCLMAIPVKAEDVLKAAVQADYGYLLELYQHLHRNPELSFQEVESSKRMAAELKGLGFTVATGVGGHGVVGVIRNGAGPTVLVRTDTDALPVTEQTSLPYASTATATEQTGRNVDVMHACGHDVHMTVWTGTARRLAAMRDQWSGTLVMIAQPAEERGAGARAMLNDGLFTRFPKPDMNLALHVNATLEAGRIGYAEGFAMANVDMVDIAVLGVGGHGAYPHATKDPIVLAAHIITALQTLVSREVSPLDPAVVTVGSINGGEKHNVIPNRVDLQLTVRSYKDQVRETLLSGITRIAKAEAEALGFPKMPVIKVRDEYTPAAYNTPELVQRLVPLWKARLGDSRVVELDPVMGGEDFGRYGRQDPRIPSFMFSLGAVDPATVLAAKESGTKLPSLHSSKFAPLPEPTITTGVETMTAAVLEVLKRED